ncbi:Diadenosine tetraphosphate (Ap4A) hydrolase [Actinopolymorpha cephalotaxi]|uniref:Diadenosine tetraphosphate (Ap4A) HIT family hydrolase n=1 Tax=Actinopolymorpha cephalotaxi TaxID=504797 RepID=A0A1I3B0J2_9ACTN|nr:HIT domain-containing protein [Actinopolymorpha cephalotaxi]NYH84258.1 diadenosine tetraphosphate (Ap4A) HIT family hydrolase [Actinopolymorpha cephalotaxi]SFH55813.1 Diadenosine tetraphosphate (Ap4A) hydrolase [Actinopolymorpha cephalotaxi]
MPWASNWDERVAGTACELCDEGRPEETKTGTRILASAVADTYLMRRALVRGYAVVVWRGRHVVEPTELSPSEAAQYGRDVLRVGHAIQRCFRPLKLNYLTMGNWTPHLHTHVTARYIDDPAPGDPLPAGRSELLPEDQWREDATALRALLTDSATT